MKRIQKLIDAGKPVMYLGKEVLLLKIEDVGILEYAITMQTQSEGQKTIKVERSKVDTLVAEFLPLEVDNTSVAIAQNSVVSQASNLFTELSKGMLEDFEKLKTDKDYIPAAKQRSDTVKTILQMTKTQIELIKLSRP